MRRIFVLFLVSIIVFTASLAAQDKQKDVTLDEIFKNYSFYPRSVYGINSLGNGDQYTSVEHNAIVVHEYKTGDSITTLVDGNKLIPEGEEEPIRIRSFKISKDETKFLFPTQTERIYRRSFKSVFYLYDTQTGKLKKLSTGKQRLADFSPDGKEVAFIRDNNIFIKDLASGIELQITKDGQFNHIINGTCDWVYEEEFGFSKAFFWSSDSRKIAYYRFDESRVKEYTLTYYGDLYPRLYTYKYPKAGEENSLVDIYVYHVDNGKTVKMDVGEETDQYIPRIKWTENPNVLAIERLNRLQNHLDILLADVNDGISRVAYTEDNKYYIEITDNLVFLPDNEHFILTSEMDGYNHIYLYSIMEGLVRQLTSGKWDVTKVYGYDKNKKRVFFQAAETSPVNRDIEYVDLKGNRKMISSKEGNNNADFSNNFRYYLNSWSDAWTPKITTVDKNNGKVERVLEDNIALVNRLKEYKLTKKEFFTIKSPEFKLPDGSQVDLNAWRMLPVNFDPNKKYPVILVVYGGTGLQEVRNSWGWGDINYMWCQLMAEKGFLIVSVDNRGTDARGQEFKKMTYMELGKYETMDYIETAKYLSTLDYVDSGRIGIVGWSYGGYMACNAITQGADYFSTAVAVAPVTNWRYYDNIYTERFMRTPQENPGGYDNNSPINHVEKLKGNLLLIHGSTDDNVHMQNTMDMVSALVKANKQFDLFIYPNKDHSMHGGNARLNLYQKMTDFLIDKMKPGE